MEPAVEVPVVTAVAVPVTAVAQPMQVTVPAGIGPGMQFPVDTPAGGQMQVTCPPGATAGMQIMVNIGGPPAIAGIGDPEFIAIMNEPGMWKGKKSVSVVTIEVTATHSGGSLAETYHTEATLCGCCPVAYVTGTQQMAPDFSSSSIQNSNGSRTTATLAGIDLTAKRVTYHYTSFDPKKGPVSGSIVIDGRSHTKTIEQSMPSAFSITLQKVA